MKARRCGPTPVWLLLIFCVTSLCSLSASAEDSSSADSKKDVYDLPTPVAIQGRTNRIDQSLGLTTGFIPTDSFNRGFPVGLSFAYYFKPYIAWEVIDLKYNFNMPTRLKGDFEALGIDTQNVGIGGVADFPKFILMTGLIYTPLYSKSLLFNRTLLHSETSFYLGVGVIQFNKIGSAATISPGLQARYFVAPHTAVRGYIRPYFYVDPRSGLNGMLEFGMGFETQLSLFGSDRSQTE